MDHVLPRLLRSFVLISLLVLTQTTASAQWELGFGAIGNVPVERFKDSDYKPGIGMFTNVTTGSMLGKVSPWKLQVGMYLDYQYAGQKKFDIELSDPVGGEGETRLSNSSTGQHLLLRYGYSFNNRWTCFTDLIVGHRKFYSEIQTGLKQEDPEYEDDVQRIHSWNTYRHGIGFGIRYGVGKSFGIEMRADYTRGNQATYFQLDKVEESNSSITYENQTWPHTDLFVGTLSLNWKLYRPKATTTPNTENKISTRDDYYDDYPKSSSTPTYGSSGTSPRSTAPKTTTKTEKTTTKKKTVSSSKTVEEKPKEKKISW